MAKPLYLLNSTGQRVISLIGSDGVTILAQIGIGSKANSYDDDGSWTGVATHTSADAYAAGTDGIVVTAGLDETDVLLETIKPHLVDVDGRLIARMQPATGGVTNKSGTIAAGGTKQTLAAVKLNRKYLFIQNLDPAEDLWFNFSTDAVVGQPSVLVPPLGSFVMEGSYVSSELISVIAATTGHAFAAKEA